jgi:hypothetical protein
MFLPLSSKRFMRVHIDQITTPGMFQKAASEKNKRGEIIA